MKSAARLLSGLAVLAVVAAVLVAPGRTPEVAAQSTPAGTEADPFIVPFHWGLKPGTIEPGDKFRLMFQTENRRNGTSSTIGDYNSFVQGDAPPGGFHADISPYVSEFKAIVSTGAVDARDNIGATGTGVQINWVNGSKVADDYTDFWDGSWDSRAPTLGSGVGAAGRNIFTGTDNDGTKFTDHAMGSGNPRYGSSRIGSPLSQGNTGNSGTRAFYAMSPVFQVDPAPPPVSVEFAKNLNQGRHQYDYNVEEGATLKPRLTFDPPTRAEATLIIHATGGTATAGVDFPAGPYYVTVPAGASRHTFDVEIPWDAAVEDYETFTLRIGKLPDGFRYDPQPSAMVQIVNVSVVPSDWSLIPAGLSTGDKFRLLFKTATERDAHPSDIADYDEFVRTRTAAHPWHADIEDYGNTFRVVGSTGAVDGNFHTGSGNIVKSQQYPGHTTSYRPVYWLGGVKIADDYRFFWRGWWGDANAPANQRHADGLAATNTRGPTTGTSYCCITVSFGTEIHGSGIRTPDPYWLGGSRSTVVKGSGVASPDTGRHVSGRNSIQDEVVRDRPRGEVAPYLALSAVFEVGDFMSTDRLVWIEDGSTPGGPGDSYYGCTDPDYVPGGDPDCEPVLTHQTIEGTRARIFEGETATFTVHVDSAPSADLTVQVNVRDTRYYVAADDPDDDVVGEGIQKIVIPSGQTSVTFTVPTIYANNEAPSGGELIVSILPGVGYRVPDGSDASRLNVGIVEIQGFWGLGDLSMSEVPGTHETDLNIPFTSAAGNSYTVHYRIVDAESTATYGTGNSADYNIRSGYNRSTNRGTFTVPAGSPSGKLPVWVNDDTRLEGTDYVVLGFTSPSNLQPNKITIPIYDNELPAKLKPYVHDDNHAAYAPEIDTTLTEGYAPESEHQIRVAGFDYRGMRIGLERAVHYEYCVEGTATLGDDYELIKPDDTKVASAGCHPVTLPNGWDRMKLVKVKVLDDGLNDEPDETVKIRLQQSTTAGMETDTSLATVPDSTRIPGETASVVITIKDTLPTLEVAYVIVTQENVPGFNRKRPVRTDCQDAGNDRCRVRSGHSSRIEYTIRTTSGLDLADYVKAHWSVEDNGDVIDEDSGLGESGSRWLDRSTKSFFDIPIRVRHDAGDGYAIFKLTESDNYKYRVKDGAGKVCVAVNDGSCPGSGAPPVEVPETAVSNLQVAAVDDASATATWDAVPGATSYQVEYQGNAVDPDSTAFVSDLISGHTGTSWTFQHNSAESMTVTVTVTPEYLDGGGVRQQVWSLGASADLDVVIAAEGDGQPADTLDEPPAPEISITAGGDITEGGSATFTLTADPAPSDAFSVNVSVAPSGDYGVATVVWTVLIGTTGSGTLPVHTTDDSVDEPDGSITATVNDGAGYTVSATAGTATVAVSDDDDPPPACTPQLPSDAVTISEVTGWRDAHSGAAHVLRWNRVLAALGVNTGESPLTAAESRANEGQFMYSRWDRVTRTLEALEQCDDTETTPTVVPPPAVEPEISITAGGDITEGGSATFTLTADPAPSDAFSVNVSVAPSGDYGVATVVWTVLIGTTGSGTLPVHTTDDSVDEPDGSITATVNDGAGYTVSAAAGTATVAVSDDDDPPPACTPQLPSDAVTISEVTGWRDAHSGAAHVLRWNRVLAALGVNTGESPLTAAESRANEGQFMYSRWDRVTRTLEALEQCDDTETTPTVVPPPAVEPEISITAGGDITEGGDATFTLTASPVPSAPLVVDVSVASTGDFGVTAATRQVTISTSGSGTLSVSTSDDNVDEADGSVTVTVDDGSGYTVSSSAGAASVAVSDDDDPPPVVVPDDDDTSQVRLAPSEVSFSVGDASATEGGTLRFPVTLSNAANAEVRVWWTTRYGGGEHRAFPGRDYQKVRGWLTFAPGDVEQWVEMPLLDDSATEFSEVFQIFLGFTEGGATISDRDATMTIIDND